MASRLVGLVGPGTGPQLSIGRFKSVRGRVRGLVDGAVDCTVEHDGGKSTVTFVCDGDLELPAGSTARFDYRGSNKSMVCSIIGED